MPTTVSTNLIDKVADWLMAQALDDTQLDALVHRCCERLAAAGVPLARANFSFSVLHESVVLMQRERPAELSR